MRLLLLLLLASTLGFAQSWSGYLVDSSCYQTDKANTNISPSTADRDMNMVLRQCSANAKTKSFALVLPDWSSLRLDSAGNAKIAEMVRNSGRKMPMEVTVTGSRANDTVTVDSISKSRHFQSGAVSQAKASQFAEKRDWAEDQRL